MNVVSRVISFLFIAISVPVGSYCGVIDFSTLTGTNGQSFLMYTQNGFTVRTASGQWFEAFSFGNPSPDIYLGPAFNPGHGSIAVADNGTRFSFSSVDISSNNGDTGYTIQGFLNGQSVFTETGIDETPSQFVTLTGTSAAAIDRLVISLSPDPIGYPGGVTSVNLDNIAYNFVPVPEPGALTFFCLFFATVMSFVLARSR